MAATAADNALKTPTSKPIPLRPSPMRLDSATLAQSRTDQLKHAALMSPVNQNGSFEFDRVLKAGTVVKRTRKTKQWKPIYIVLRANLLSIYRDKDETKLRHQINLSEITAVARQKDSKKKMDHVFAIFSPARNYHLGASTEKDAQEWVDLIRREARIDEEDEEMILMSPMDKKAFPRFDQAKRENIGSSSSEAEPRPSSSIAPENMHSARRPSTINYTSNDYGSFSDFSDTYQAPSNGLPKSAQQNRNVSKQSNVDAVPDDERVVYHGWLYVLKAKGGVRQWKKVWVVLRPKALGIYKNDQEYSAIRIIPFESIIDAVDLDPVSKSRQHCMQVISEEKNLRFSAADEDSLAKWLGAFKSLLVKRKEAGARAGNGQPASRRPSSQQNSQKPARPSHNPPVPAEPVAQH